MPKKVVRPGPLRRPKRKKPPRKARSERVANKRPRRGKGGIPESIQKAIVNAVFGFLL